MNFKLYTARFFTTSLLFAYLWICATAVADDTAPDVPYTHAQFVTGKRSMERLVDYPDVDIDFDIIVSCTGRATAKGRLKGARCSSPQDPDLEFTMAISRRFNASRLVPATVDGVPQEVDFQFSVVFTNDGINRGVGVYPNNRKNVDRLGESYISAQRYSPHPFPSRCQGWRQDGVLMEVAIVESSGRAREVDILSSTSSIPSGCRDAFLNQLEDARWIPASLDGELVESVWVNPIVLSRVSYKREQP